VEVEGCPGKTDLLPGSGVYQYWDPKAWEAYDMAEAWSYKGVEVLDLGELGNHTVGRPEDEDASVPDGEVEVVTRHCSLEAVRDRKR